LGRLRDNFPPVLPHVGVISVDDLPQIGKDDRMQLIDWMKTEGIDDQQVADRLSSLPEGTDKSISAFAVKKWKYGERIPRPDEMRGLYAISAGKVGPNDFYGIEPVSAAS
jgi:hypothetical protein